MANNKAFIAKNGYALGDGTTAPTSTPVQNWNFKNSKSLDPRFIFERSSTAVYYDGTTTHLTDQNKYKYSEDFTNVFWDKVGVTVTANTQTAPDGTTTADTLTAEAGGTYHNINNDSNLEDTQVCSIFAKAGTADYIIIGYNTTNHVSFNLSTGAITATTGSNIAGTILSVGNGWYRCTANYTGTGNVSQWYMFVATSSGGISYSAAGTETIHVWGAQLEWLRDTASAYMHTSATTVNNFSSTMLTAATATPRFDHNPRTGESLGLMLEAQATNKIYPSNPATGWIYNNVIQYNTITPDGNQSACVFASTTTNAQHFISYNFPVTAGVTQTKSVYVKDYGLGQVSVHLSTATFVGGSIHFNFSTKVITVGGTDITDYGYQDVGDGWYRLWLVATPDATANDTFYIGVYDLNTRVGNGVDGVAIWGVQQQDGPAMTSYIPTTTATVTKSQDTMYIVSGDLHLPANYSLYFDWDSVAPVTLDYRQSISTVYYTSSDWHDMGPNSYGGTNNINSFMYYNNTSAITTLTSLPTEKRLGIAPEGNNIKVAYSFGDNNFRMTTPGPATTTDTGYDRWEIDQSRLYIGSRHGSSQWMIGYVKQVKIYPELLSSDNLAYLVED